jgi:hypothetical protein
MYAGVSGKGWDGKWMSGDRDNAVSVDNSCDNSFGRRYV